MYQDPMLPPVVARALAEYRSLLADHGITWGEPPLGYVRMMSFLRFPDEAYQMSNVPDLDRAFRDALRGHTTPDGLTVLQLTPNGLRLEARPLAVLSATPLPGVLLVDSARDEPATVHVDGAPYPVPPGGARLIEITTASTLTIDGEPVDLSVLTRAAVPARLRLSAGFPCRWSVTTADGQGWYPDGADRRRDYHGEPFFHGDDLLVEVPAEPLTVRVTRGMEYSTAEAAVHPAPWRETLVELAPERLYDAAARGWYGADLHVHLNWAGDIVATPAAAAAMQHGEDLHVLNLVAGNVAGERVYDKEALHHWAGRDLPWSDATHVARMGVEYRNDLLGHVHAFGLVAPPSSYHTGFVGQADWPPNGAACGELRELGAVIGYAHPFHGRVEHPADVVRAGERNCEARALVVDAALGLVDGMELLHFSEIPGTVTVYRRLVGAGNRLAALAGTDTMLSFTRQDTVSSPPGWERVYARLSGPLSADSFANAVRLGRTFATTGPWLELTVVDEATGLHADLGDTLHLRPGDRVTVTVRTVGPEVERLELHTADGVIATGPGGELTTTLDVTTPTYLVAAASGGRHPRSLHREVYAHTSPVYLDVAGRHVARPEDVHWCLEWLNLLSTTIRDHARLDSRDQLRDHLDLIEKAITVYRSRLI
ncbi:CehA/McbA family metallohydrolase [Acrocarpospora catenulata]|uniref:CehA/McbA family metallohydrolase n=1 Tax=Acrocarpospora catenulata TaxID=2836182 RepID=UPI001BD96F3E|nr:CehA/McbA family metallohydrolase [Acrocarpospora catenulata]